MSPERAASIIPHYASLKAEARTNFYGGAWVIWARVGEDYVRPVTQTMDPAIAARWINRWHELTEE